MLHKINSSLDLSSLFVQLSQNLSLWLSCTTDRTIRSKGTIGDVQKAPGAICPSNSFVTFYFCLIHPRQKIIAEIWVTSDRVFLRLWTSFQFIEKSDAVSGRECVTKLIFGSHQTNTGNGILQWISLLSMDCQLICFWNLCHTVDQNMKTGKQSCRFLSLSTKLTIRVRLDKNLYIYTKIDLRTV